MDATSRSKMHADHLAWESEDALWRDDLRVWETEVAEAQQQMHVLHELLGKHLSQLRTHAAAIRAYEQEVRTHERALAEQERGSTEFASSATAKGHRDECQNQVRQRAEHERLKRVHHGLMAHWRTLVRAVQEGVAESC